MNFTIVYIIIAFLMVALSISEVTKKRKVKRRKKEEKELRKDILTYAVEEKVDEQVIKNALIRKHFQRFVKRTSMVDSSSRTLAERKVKGQIVKICWIGIITFAVTLLIFGIWYIALVGSLAAVYLTGTLITGKIDKKISEIEMEFPSVIQRFTDEYIVTGNIKSSIMAVAEKSKGSISVVFEQLIRDLYSGKNEEEAITDLAETLDFYYGYAFAEILKLSLSDVGDVSKELEFLMELMQDDLQESEKTKAEMFENKIMFILLNAITLVIVVVNLIVHPYGREIYVYTKAGNGLVVFLILEIIGGLSFMSLSEKS